MRNFRGGAVLAALAGAALVAGFAARTPAEEKGATKDEVEAVLKTQAEAWNRGDLEGFMATYWKDERLSFYSGDTVTKGWQATIDRYRKRYQAEGKEMGKLTFTLHETELLGTDAAIVKAAWELKLKDGNPKGLFTLVLKRIGGKWAIVHDHTSAKSG